MTLKPNPSPRRLPPPSRSSAMAADGSVLRRLYFSVYNWVVFIGWAQVSLSMILALLDDGHEAVYAAIERHLLFAQTAAIMEILHSILGLVRSPVSSTLPQITGRLFITWGILWSFPETHSHILVTPLIISWSITEVIRYSFFGIKESFGFTPSWLLWLRYSTFIVCYPVGMVSEVGLIYIAFPFMKASEKYCIGMPNKWNFSFDYFYFSTFLMAFSAMAADGSMVRRLYLSIYNWVAFIGWAQVLCYTILALLDKGHEAVYAAIERPLLFTQTAAILEVLGELEIERVGEVSSVFYSPTNYWKVTRYSFYGMKESFGFTPSWLLWLRYSTFIACFPVGVVSEICLAYTVLPFMKASEKYCLRMPNKWNFSFNYFYANGMASVLRRLYLSVYNWIVFIRWVQVSWSMILALLEKRYEAVYAAVEQHLLFAQTAAIMEILHSIVGLVRSPVSSTLPQITGRLFMIWGILRSFPEIHTHIFVTSLLISWCITEVTRYSFYGMKESFGFTPSWLLWLRYSTFIVCFPVGMVSEVGLVYIVVPFMKASEKYCLRMPNKWNFSIKYFYASVFFMVLYAPVYLHLFHYLIVQRKKALAKSKTT
uniref:Very-long-chain (3R)-3-hydroxyacyl-CoA dehydratase n=1 Tax=Oryza barthii TaxID=65489 RepID=A0A0D3EJM6_9ORYZ